MIIWLLSVYQNWSYNIDLLLLSETYEVQLETDIPFTMQTVQVFSQEKQLLGRFTECTNNSAFLYCTYIYEKKEDYDIFKNAVKASFYYLLNIGDQFYYFNKYQLKFFGPIACFDFFRSIQSIEEKRLVVVARVFTCDQDITNSVYLMDPESSDSYELQYVEKITGEGRQYMVYEINCNEMSKYFYTLCKDFNTVRQKTYISVREQILDFETDKIICLQNLYMSHIEKGIFELRYPESNMTAMIFNQMMALTYNISSFDVTAESLFIFEFNYEDGNPPVQFVFAYDELKETNLLYYLLDERESALIKSHPEGYFIIKMYSQERGYQQFMSQHYVLVMDKKETVQCYLSQKKRIITFTCDIEIAAPRMVIYYRSKSFSCAYLGRSPGKYNFDCNRTQDQQDAAIVYDAEEYLFMSYIADGALELKELGLMSVVLVCCVAVSVFVILAAKL